MTQPAEQVRALLSVTADHLPGGPIGVALPDLLARARSERPRRGPRVAAAFILVLLTVAVPVVVFGRNEPGPASLPGYSVPAVDAFPTSGPAGAAALVLGRWTRLPAAPIAGRADAATVWTGQQMVVWGGASGRDRDHAYADGAAYDPSSGQWQVLPAGPLAPRSNMAYVWTGSQLFIWGGYEWVNGQRQVSGDGALYDPSTGTWRQVATSPLAARANAITLWTGAQVVVIGGQPATSTDSLRGYFDAAAYDPATNQWRRLPAIPTEQSRPMQYLTAAATPSGIYVWSHWAHWEMKSDGSYTGDSGLSLLRYDPQSGAWQTLDAAQPIDLGSPLWTGRDLIFPAAAPWRGFGSGPPSFNMSGWRWDPSTGTWQRLAHGPVDDLNAASVWTGAALLSFDSTSVMSGPNGAAYQGAAGVWDPSTNQWTRLPDAPFVGSNLVNAVWTGSHLLKWGLMHPSMQAGARDSEVGLSFGQ
jgi:hypothetical protein